jgi:di- and tripeptidase
VIYDEDGTAITLNSQGGRVLTIPSRNYLPYAHKSYVYSMILVKGIIDHDRDDEVLITGAGDGTIKLWSLDSLSAGAIIQRTKFKNDGSNVLSLSYRGSFLYAGLSDGVANVYNLASNQLVQRLQVGYGDVTQILVNPDNILCGTSEGFVKVSFCLFGCPKSFLNRFSDSMITSRKRTAGEQRMAKF